MEEKPHPRDLQELLRQAYNTLPRHRFWKTVAIGLGLGIAMAVPLVALLEFHEGPWTGFLWDSLFGLPFVLLCVAFLLVALKSIRAGKWKEAAEVFLALAFFAFFTYSFCAQFVRQVKSIVHLHRMQGNQVHTVRVACHATDDPILIQQIMTDLRGAQWYSPMSHGWSPYAYVTLEFSDGHKEHYSLTEFLAEGRLVIRLGEGNAGLAAVPHLSVSMQQAGLLKVAIYPRHDNKGYYQAIVPASVCKQANIGDD